MNTATSQTPSLLSSGATGVHPPASQPTTVHSHFLRGPAPSNWEVRTPEQVQESLDMLVRTIANHKPSKKTRRRHDEECRGFIFYSEYEAVLDEQKTQKERENAYLY